MSDEIDKLVGGRGDSSQGVVCLSAGNGIAQTYRLTGRLWSKQGIGSGCTGVLLWRLAMTFLRKVFVIFDGKTEETIQ